MSDQAAEEFVDADEAPAAPQLRVVGDATERMRAKATSLAHEMRRREEQALEDAVEAREAQERSLTLARAAADRAKLAEERADAAEGSIEEARLRFEESLDSMRGDIKATAKATLIKIAGEARERVDAARQTAREAQKAASEAEGRLQAADRLAKENEVNANRLADRESREKRALEEKIQELRKSADRSLRETTERMEADTIRRVDEAKTEVTNELEARVVEAERRARRAEEDASDRIAIAEKAARDAEEEADARIRKIEADIERRIMQGTEEVREDAARRVDDLVARVEREAEASARLRADEQLRTEEERLRAEAERKSEIARRGIEAEVKSATSRARRQALAAADATAPSYEREDGERASAGQATAPARRAPKPPSEESQPGRPGEISVYRTF